MKRFAFVLGVFSIVTVGASAQTLPNDFSIEQNGVQLSQFPGGNLDDLAVVRHQAVDLAFDIGGLCVGPGRDAPGA